MRFGLSTWQPKHLLAAWSTYWLALLVWGIGSALPAFWRISQPDAKGSASVNFGDKGVELTVMDGAVTAFHGAISFRLVVLLGAVPPLILWAFWLRAHRRGEPAVPRPLLDEPSATFRPSVKQHDHAERRGNPP